MNTTIVAISSPIGVGGIGIVRVSGTEALTIANALFSFKHKGKWQPLFMNFGTFQTEEFSDKGYAVYFPAKQAYTGEDTVEFYLHGGVRIMKGAVDAILKKGAKLADKGEFTKRAFLSGRLNLADAEGVMDMINAESSAGLRAAYRLMNGETAKRINLILEKLETLISALEASLDYPDEMEDEVMPVLPKEIEELISDITKLLKTSKQGKMAKDGINVVLAGKTNAGKSSVMNALLQYDRAIVTPTAGTTRDIITESFECDGVKINLVDTAGIRESNDAIENQGIERAKEAFKGADIILHIIDTTDPDRETLEFDQKLVFTVLNKCDLTSFACPRSAYTFAISATTGENIDVLAMAIASVYKRGEVEGGDIITSQRHISALYQAESSLKNAFAAINTNTIDCILIDLRDAYNALGEITGKTATEDIVDKIFSRFCVGK